MNGGRLGCPPDGLGRTSGPPIPGESKDDRGGPLEVKIVCLDHYRSGQGHGRGLPVIRVYGVTKHTGQKIAVHVHKVLPYFFVPLPEVRCDMPFLHAVPMEGGRRLEEHFGEVFWKALDGALELHHSLVFEGGGDRERLNGGFDGGHSRISRVADVQVVKAVPFYGYHRHEVLWLKIIMYDPGDVKRAARLVENGAVLGMKFQPHESHIPYLLQFKIDHNLYGMDWLKLRGGCYRGGVLPTGAPLPPGFTSSDALTKQTTCALEIDVCTSDILNMIEKKHGVDITLAPMEEQIVDSLVPMWAAERARQGRSDVAPTPPDIGMRFVEQIDSATVAYWREKFREAEESRVNAEGPSGDEDTEKTGTNVMNETFGSQLLSQDHSEDPSHSYSQRHLQGLGTQRPSIDLSLLGSLVDVDIVRSTQWVGVISMSDKHNHAPQPNDVMTEWGERQRELGFTFRAGEDDPEDDQLMELVDLVRGEEAAGTQRVCSQNEGGPSRFSLEQRVQHTLQEDALSAHNECHDIMEASQMFEAEIKMEKDGVDSRENPKRGTMPDPGCSDRKPEEWKTPKDEAKVPTFASEREREQVREAGRRLSEIRELFTGTPRRERRAPARVKGGPLPGIPCTVSPVQPIACAQPVTSHGRNGDAMEIEPRNVMEFWSEPASQVPFEDGVESMDEVDEGVERGQIDDCKEQLGDHTEIKDYKLTAQLDTLDVGNEIVMEPKRPPPSRLEVAALPVIHTGPHFSNAADMGKRKQVFGGKMHRLYTSVVCEMPPFGSAKDLLETRLGHLQVGGVSRALQARLGPNQEHGSRGFQDGILLELPRQPPKRADVEQWMIRVDEMHASFRDATKAAIVSNGHAATLDPNSGKYLPEGTHSVSQTSLVATPLLPSWECDIEDDVFGVDRCPTTPGQLPMCPGEATKPSVPSVASDPNISTPPCPSSSQNPVRPASPKYDEIDALYKDVLDGEGVNEQVIRRGSRALHRQSFSQISWGGSHSTDATPQSQMGLNPAKRSATKGEGLTILCVEVHAESRQALLPDPTRDAICAVFLTMWDDCDVVVSGQYYTRIIMVKQRERVWPNFEGMEDVEFDYVGSERELFSRFRDSVISLDPDVLLGFEIQRSSLGYMADRARSAFDHASFLSDISRVPSERVELTELGENDQYGWDHDSGIRVAGRIVLNMWRTIRAEVKLQSYSFENCVASILKIRVPRIKRPDLHRLFTRHETRWRCLSHYALCNRLCLHMIEQLDFIGRTSELARTFGIDFFSVVSRGSQYRVESMMLRLAHSQNYVALSPNNEQVARQPAMEALPLVMEPESGMYEDPVCVLDFQSLYPSMIIAYNLCFSTCIGRPHHLSSQAPQYNGDPCRDNEGTNEDFGTVTGTAAGADMDTIAQEKLEPVQSRASFRNVTGTKREPKSPRLGCRESFALDASLAASNIDPSKPSDLIVTPNGIGFVPPSRRRGVLPRLLHEILQTRIMIKSAMRNAPPNAKSLTRSLNAKQFALKLIANVTYGYTAAGFSGRMPMAELADAIVQSGRETLEDTIRFIKNHPEWNADVIYGDTDSIFVRLKGRTRQEAHRIGLEMAKAVTARNPDPVLLKLEKVYHPCFLLSKKRYVGAMYESPDQPRFQFDAKGIETVRRDSCPAVSKIVEQSLRILFTSADVSAVKTYVERQWKRIISGRVSIMDFIFAKEVRLGTYAAERAPGGAIAASIPPAALVATKAMAKDPRAEPRYGERVSYVVIHGEPGARLIDMVVEPETLVESGGTLRLHAVYYITKQIIPALERFMRLIGVNVQAWYARIPKATRYLPHKRPLSALGGTLTSTTTHKPTIDHFYLSRHCICCDALTMVNEPLCRACQDDKQLVAFVLPHRLNRIERQYVHIGRICSTCGGVGPRGEIICESLDCSMYFERRKVWYERKTVQGLARCLDDH